MRDERLLLIPCLLRVEVFQSHLIRVRGAADAPAALRSHPLQNRRLLLPLALHLEPL